MSRAMMSGFWVAIFILSISPQLMLLFSTHSAIMCRFLNHKITDFNIIYMDEVIYMYVPQLFDTKLI